MHIHTTRARAHARTHARTHAHAHTRTHTHTHTHTHNTVQRMGPRVSRQAANRWLVAYTLLRNESIRTLTASRLRENPKRKEKKKHKKKPKGKDKNTEEEEGGAGGEEAGEAGGEETGVTRVIIETPEPSVQSGASSSDQQWSRNETSSTEDTNM